MNKLKLVELRPNQPALTDIPGRLRALADRIEALGPEIELCLVVTRDKTNGKDCVNTYAYGNYVNMYECAGILLAAAANFDE